MKLLITALLALTMTACSLLPQPGTTESLAVNYLFSKATTAVIDRGAVTPEQVLDAVRDAKQYVEGSETVSVSRLYEAALDRIEGLDAADRVLVTAILDNARIRLETAMDSGDIDASDRVFLMDVLSWIELAARAEM